MKNILVLIDLFSESYSWIKWIENVQVKQKANVFPVKMTCSDVGTYEFKFLDFDDLLANIKSTSGFERDKLKKLNENDQINNNQAKPGLYLIGNLIKGINKAINDKEIDYMIMGMNQSVSTPPFNNDDFYIELLKKNSCPVIIIPEDGQNYSIRDAGVFFLDLYHFDVSKMDLLKDIMNIYTPRIHLMSVVNPAEMNNCEIIEKMEDVAEEGNLDSFTLNTAYNTDVNDGLDFFMNKKSLDLLAIMEKNAHDVSPVDLLSGIVHDDKCVVYWDL